MSDLAATLSIDTSDFVGPCEESANIAEQSGERVIRVIHEQQGSWLQLTTAAVPAIATITSAIAGYAATAATIAHQQAMFASVSSGWTSIAGSAMRYLGIANTVARTLIPQYRAIGLAVGATVLAYKAATSETGENAAKAVLSSTTVQESYARLKASTSGLTEALSRPFQGAQQTAGALAQYIITEWTPLPLLGRKIGEGIAFGLDFAAARASEATAIITSTTDAVTGLALSFSAGEWGNTADKFTQETVALRELAAETERVMTLQNSHRSQYKMLADAQTDAAERASKASEIAEIGHIVSAEAIDSETRRYQQLFAAQIQSLKAGEQLTAGQQAHMKNVIDALAAQKAGIESGRITEDTVKEKDASVTGNNAAAAYERATESLNRLKYGQEEAARMAIMASDATDEEVVALLALHDETVALQRAQEQQKTADQLYKSGAERIEAMTDNIDLLTGAATKAEIEMRKLARAGYSQEQIDKIGELTAKTEELSAKQSQPKETRETKNKASFIGSSETASLILKGVGSGAKGSDKILLDQYAALKAIAQNTKHKSSGQVLLAGKINGY